MANFIHNEPIRLRSLETLLDVNKHLSGHYHSIQCSFSLPHLIRWGNQVLKHKDTTSELSR